MIYIIITASLINQDFDIREKQYENGISMLFDVLKYNNILANALIVENNGKRKTFLENFNIPVLYTNNNKINTPNKGIKELLDIKECIEYFNIQDDDFVVKLTGRYIIEMDSYFFQVLKNLNENIDCIIKYGWWGKFSDKQIEDCITGLIGARCKYVKMIEIPRSDVDCVEWRWAAMTYKIPIKKIHIIKKKIGIKICPGGNNYFDI
jgi:hypothetical protein